MTLAETPQAFLMLASLTRLVKHKLNSAYNHNSDKERTHVFIEGHVKLALNADKIATTWSCKYGNHQERFYEF